MGADGRGGAGPLARAARRGGAGRQGSRRLNPDDTIVALSSGAPPAAIAVVRISGPAAFGAAASLAGSLPAPRRAVLRTLRDADGAVLDRALVLVFPGRASATGENLVELHCHGGRAVIEAVLHALLAFPGTRAALGGEFTRRALLHGRLDLAEAEGIADLLEAETETQRRAAMAAVEGRVSNAVRGWLDRLAVLSAELEASIDYAEEGDVGREGASLAAVDRARLALAEDIDAVLTMPPVERWRDGIRIVVAGPTNAGKSTLINLLGAREAAIVSATAGTTRDLIEVPVRRNGIGYVLVDTAGFRDDSGDPIERIGIERARAAMGSAHLVLWLGDGPPPARDHLWVHPRADLPDRRALPSGAAVAVSRSDPGSLERLWSAIEDRAQRSIHADALPLRRREWNACAAAANLLQCSVNAPEFLAEHVRQAAGHLASIIGADATEAMLDALFSRFCVGK